MPHSRESIPWPSTGSASENLFETRKDWPICPSPTPTSAPTVENRSPTPSISDPPCDGDAQASH